MKMFVASTSDNRSGFLNPVRFYLTATLPLAPIGVMERPVFQSDSVRAGFVDQPPTLYNYDE